MSDKQGGIDRNIITVVDFNIYCQSVTKHKINKHKD